MGSSVGEWVGSSAPGTGNPVEAWSKFCEYFEDYTGGRCNEALGPCCLLREGQLPKPSKTEEDF